ncbi:HDIG domain-containing protein [Clostridium tetani]|nr:HDIG domain-containing protein [Clostridium tetani]
MKFYRIKQFYLNLIDRMKIEDEIFVDKYLTRYEKELFKKLSKSDQKHSVRVAYSIKSNCINKNKDRYYTERLIKIALLHDIGKINCNLNVLDKSILVILDCLTKGKLRNLSNIKKINTYYNHGEIAFHMLKYKGYDNQFLDIIRNHHSRNYVSNEELNMLKSSDAIN